MEPIKHRRQPFTDEQRKQHAKAASARRNTWLKSLSPEEQAEHKQRVKWAKEDRLREKESKLIAKQTKLDNKRELNILKFMLKHDVLYYHHNTSDSSKTKILKQIEAVKRGDGHKEYDSYIWNYQGEGKNYMSRCLLGNIFSSSEFETIYDVPLDGTYSFHIYDSGQRGLGSFNRIKAEKVEVKPLVPYVNPGALIPITAN